MLKKLLADPSILLRAPRIAFQSQVGNPSAIQTPHPRLWVLMRIIGRFTSLRGLGIKLSKPLPRGSVKAAETTQFPAVSVDDVVARLKKDGFAEGLDLSPEVTEKIVAFARETPFAVNKAGGPKTSLAEVDGGTVPEGLTLGEYEHPSASSLIDELSRDPVLLQIAERYLGVTPRHSGTRLWWSFPAPQVKQELQSAASQLFHFDLDDFKFLKFFFYLSDVDETAGPHIAVLGTHARKKLAHQAVIRRLTDQEVEQAYGAQNVKTICLPAGKGFAEDTFCLHKGQTPTGTRRLLLQFEYGVNDFHSGG